MKTIVNKSQVAHLFAAQSQNYASVSGRNFYFQDKVIYSYGSHFPIAKHVTNNEGLNGLLFTERSYSNSTSKHISVVRYTCNHLDFIYCYNPEYTHSQNFAEWLKTAQYIIKNKLPNARKPEIYILEIGQIADKAKRYAEFFGLQIPADLQTALNVSNKIDGLDFAVKMAESIAVEQNRQKETAKIRLKKEQKEFTAKLKKWYNFETNSLYNRPFNVDYLRYNLNTKRIETNQRVEIPVEIGRLFFEKVLNGTVKEGDCLLNYIVIEVNNKQIKIGCHCYDVKYLVNFGKKLYNL